MTDSEPLPQWINSVFSKTDDLMVEVARPAYRFLGKDDLLEALGIDASDVFTMAQIATRLQLIASNIEARGKQTLKVVQNG